VLSSDTAFGLARDIPDVIDCLVDEHLREIIMFLLNVELDPGASLSVH